MVQSTHSQRGQVRKDSFYKVGCRLAGYDDHLKLTGPKAGGVYWGATQSKQGRGNVWVFGF